MQVAVRIADAARPGPACQTMRVAAMSLTAVTSALHGRGGDNRAARRAAAMRRAHRHDVDLDAVEPVERDLSRAAIAACDALAPGRAPRRSARSRRRL